MWADIGNHKHTVASLITSIQGVDDSQADSAIPRLGVTEEEVRQSGRMKGD